MHAPTKSRRGGFTLIELLAVILIISILMAFLLPRIPEAIDRSKVTACKKNLQEIYSGLMIHQDKHGRVPDKSGAQFFATLISKGVWENTEATAQKLTCPGVDLGALTIGSMEPDQWFADIDSVDGTYSSYAGRDMKNSPLKKFPGSGKEPLVADDNDGSEEEGNHRTTTVVLYADGNVGTHELYELQEKGDIDKETLVLKVGPDSPLEELRKLSLD